MKTIYDIETEKVQDLGGEYVELLELLEDEDITEEEFEERMKGLSISTNEEIERILTIATEYQTRGEAKIAFAKTAQDRINMKKKSGESDCKHANYLKKCVKNVLILRNEKKFQGEIFRATVKNNADYVEIDNPEDIPADFLIEQDPKVDLKKLKEYLTTLEKENKTCTFAHLRKSTSLLVK